MLVQLRPTDRDRYKSAVNYYQYKVGNAASAKQYPWEVDRLAPEFQI